MSASGGQIRQMVNFILQEAHEKANEIRIKVRFFVEHVLCFVLLT
jgi:vacuolar-type H+-ATPase subunit E/Vma4